MSDDVIAAALADAEALESQAKMNVSDDELGSIQKLSAEQIRLEDFLETLAEITKAAQDGCRRIREELLPEALMSADIKSFELSDGSKVSVAKKYIGSITKENEDKALAWFKETKRSGVITPNVTLPFAKGHLEEAEAAVEKLKSMGIEVTMKPGVHWQTLRAVVRELYESGDEIPDCISTHVINEAKIKRK